MGKDDEKYSKSVSAKLMFFGIFMICFLSTSMFALVAEPSGDARASLKRAGGNRGELETALRKVKGKDTEYLIAHASQYDLVNLTAEQVVENVTYACKVHQALPYLGRKMDDGLWRDWVLPHWVLDEVGRCHRRLSLRRHGMGCG